MANHQGAGHPGGQRSPHWGPALMLTLSPKQAGKDNQYPLIATIRILTSFSSRYAAPKKRKEHLAISLVSSLLHFLPLSFPFTLSLGQCFMFFKKTLTETTTSAEIFMPKHFTQLLSQCTMVMFVRCLYFPQFACTQRFYWGKRSPSKEQFSSLKPFVALTAP